MILTNITYKVLWPMILTWHFMGIWGIPNKKETKEKLVHTISKPATITIRM